MRPLDTDSIQALLFRGFRRHRFATFLLLRVAEPAPIGGWLSTLLEDDALHFGRHDPPDHLLQVAVSRTGLEALGVLRSHLATFGAPFFEGMRSPHRSRILGDRGASAPAEWSWGRADTPVDWLLAVYSRSEDESRHAERVDRELERARGAGLELLERLPASPFPPVWPEDGNLREHFGFADGISQPVFEGSGLEPRLSPLERRLHLLPAGEFVLGRSNAYGRIPPVPLISDTGPAFGIDGSYLVLRQLSQDVAGFWRYFDQQGGDGDPRSRPDRATRLAAKAVGRWPDGSPLTTCPHGPDPARGRENDFRFRAGDPHGERCPVGSHLRRSFPRDSGEIDPDEAVTFANTHRILRRGRSYGQPVVDPRKDDGSPRGLLFACLCANLERQFEFVQQSWVDNDSFGGLQGESDPLIGSRPEGGGRFTIPGQPFRHRLSGMPDFVTVRGGAYLFLPGREGLAQLTRVGR